MEQGEFIDTGLGKGIGSPKELILAHLNRMSINIFQGHSLPTISAGKNQEINKSPDKRETFIQATEFLMSIAMPYYDDQMRKEQKEFKQSLQEKDKELCLSSIASESIELAKQHKNFYEGYEYWKKKLLQDKVFLITKASAHYEHYISTMYQLHLDLFQKIQFLLFRKKWLVMTDYSEDEIEEE